MLAQWRRFSRPPCDGLNCSMQEDSETIMNTTNITNGGGKAVRIREPATSSAPTSSIINHPSNMDSGAPPISDPISDSNNRQVHYAAKATHHLSQQQQSEFPPITYHNTNLLSTSSKKQQQQQQTSSTAESEEDDEDDFPRPPSLMNMGRSGSGRTYSHASTPRSYISIASSYVSSYSCEMGSAPTSYSSMTRRGPTLERSSPPAYLHDDEVMKLAAAQAERETTYMVGEDRSNRIMRPPKLRRSFSHSNLHDRTASIERPSVVQCIRAIGFLLEHMMKEDSYREKCIDYDFSGPLNDNDSESRCGGRNGCNAAEWKWDSEEGPVDDDDDFAAYEIGSEDVSDFLDRAYSLCKWTPECNIMALILVIRLFQYNPDMTLHPGNWRRILLTALMIAQKTWDDRALRNKDFPQIWAAVMGGPEEAAALCLEEVNEMERRFLTCLDHQIFIAPSTYASTYFELCSLVPSEEEIRRQLSALTEMAGANVRVVMRSTQHHRPIKRGEMPHLQGGGNGGGNGGGGGGPSISYNTAEVIYDSSTQC